MPESVRNFLRLRLGLKPVFDYVESRHRLVGVRDLPIRTVFDVGGNVGKKARYYRQIFPEALIYSIEPVPACYDKLSRWAETQDGKVKAFNLAMGSQSGNTKMWWDRAHPGGSSIMPARFDTAVGEEISIRVETLDGLAAGLELRDEILVKIDTEGYDLEVVRGGTELLRRAAVVIIEILLVDAPGENPDFGQFMRVLEPLGFMFRGMAGVGWDHGVPIGCDAVFIKQPGLRRRAADKRSL